EDVYRDGQLGYKIIYGKNENGVDGYEIYSGTGDYQGKALLFYIDKVTTKEHYDSKNALTVTENTLYDENENEIQVTSVNEGDGAVDQTDYMYDERGDVIRLI